jgi:2-polyprenyl-3-methyl-5-hydroxy-6-metoxy-1,4-benzoquinol methylase|tara:strand:+ start:172 stop:1074 length:903 start_codon:yes stop_codon:yes gene_type:complete
VNFLKIKNFSRNNNITKVDSSDKTVKKVTEFYNFKPFPHYKKDDNKNTILEKGNKNLLTKEFKKEVGFNKNILEVGCGTGQLSSYLSIGTNNNVVAMDATLQSLNLAEEFAKKNNLQNINFLNADIFDDVLVDNFFDFIWCNGVLHHTKNPYEAFKIILKSLKKDGYILIGLYNKIGRVRTKFRKLLFRIFGKKILLIVDPTLRNLKKDSDEQIAWIRDQYQHPVESLHTLDEVIKWFNKNDIEFISSIPSSDYNEVDYKNLFKKTSIGNFFSRCFSQIEMIFSKLGRDGGLFIVIGRKK